jgi:uncharacterized protein (TIGR02217 family)
MSNALFPTLAGQGWDIERTWEWKNTGRESGSGRVFKSAHWNTPRCTYKLKFDVLRAGADAELQTLVGFFNQRKGGFDTFLFRDPADHETDGIEPLGLGDGVNAQFQLLRTWGGHQQPVFDISGTPLVYLNTGGGYALQASGYTISSTGLLTFSAPPAAGVVPGWAGEYLWRCEFTDDSLSAKEFLQDLHSSGIEFRTYKP